MEFEKILADCKVEYVRDVKDGRGEYRLMFFGGTVLFYGNIKEVEVGTFQSAKVFGRVWAPGRIEITVQPLSVPA